MKLVDKPTLSEVIAYAEGLESEVERLRASVKDREARIDWLGAALKEAEQSEERLRAYIKRVAWALGSPKDEDRLDEALSCVLASYRQRAEQSEARLAKVVEALRVLRECTYWENMVAFQPAMSPVERDALLTLFALAAAQPEDPHE